MGVMWFSEYTAIISLNSINQLTTECFVSDAMCPVQTGFDPAAMSVSLVPMLQ
jgi:hypothetical protein